MGHLGRPVGDLSDGRALKVYSTAGRRSLANYDDARVEHVRLFDADGDGNPDFLFESNEGRMLVMTRGGSVRTSALLTGLPPPDDGPCF